MAMTAAGSPLTAVVSHCVRRLSHAVGRAVCVCLPVCACSPNVIDIWEGLVTLILFPLLVGLAYYADIGVLKGPGGGGGGASVGAVGPSTASHRRRVEVGASTNGSAYAQVHSKAFYRMNATRAAAAGLEEEAVAEIRDERRRQREAKHPVAGYLTATSTSKARRDQTVDVMPASVELTSGRITTSDLVTSAEVCVFRSGSLALITSVGYTVTSPTGEIEAEGRLTFDPTQQSLTLRVQILPDDAAAAGGRKGGAAFTVSLKEPSRGAGLGKVVSCGVHVISGKAPGVLTLVEDTLRPLEGTPMTLTLKRVEGARTQQAHTQQAHTQQAHTQSHI